MITMQYSDGMRLIYLFLFVSVYLIFMNLKAFLGLITLIFMGILDRSASLDT